MFIALIVGLSALIALNITTKQTTHCVVSSVIASEGDTLWNVAKANCFGNSTTNMVGDIEELNPELKTRYLRVGEVINLPTQK